ncbi:MAG TPA: hypothetical protein P5550_03845 [Bacteroidales bacterium]|nr:hypothetical protein [Bacteroidales bacterium]HRZ76749.1 hypothetical protein [Bacteroidales bacterium]
MSRDFRAVLVLGLPLWMIFSTVVFTSCKQEKTREGLSPAAVSPRLMTPENLLDLVPPPPQDYHVTNTILLTDTATGDSIANASLSMQGEGGEEIYVTVSDYLKVPQFYTLATGLWKPELSFERDGSYARELQLPKGQVGWESYDLSSMQGTALIGVKGRYLVSLRTEKMNPPEAARAWLLSGWIEKLP